MKGFNNFQSSLKLFKESEFLRGLEQIDLSIERDPNNSILYSNRALFMVEMGHCRQAMKDLKLSLELNNLNYVSYFNLFSLNVGINCLAHALQDLYCALSAIYLIAAKQYKSYDYVKKAVEYANNNTEARVLKRFMQLQKGNFKEAYEDMIWACGIENQSNILSKVRDLIKRMGQSVHSNQQQGSSETSSQKKQSKRLECSIIVDQHINLETEIYQKLDQFNQIYQIVTNNQGFKTQKIGQRQRNKLICLTKKSSHQEKDQIQNNHDQNTNLQDQIGQINKSNENLTLNQQKEDVQMEENNQY